MRHCRGLPEIRGRGRPLIGSLAGREVRMWAAEERGKKSCGVPESSGTHSDVPPGGSPAVW